VLAGPDQVVSARLLPQSAGGDPEANGKPPAEAEAEAEAAEEVASKA
jgi:hypothetical protein